MVWYPGKNIIGGIRNVGHNIMDRRRDAQALRERATGPQGPAPQVAGAPQMFGQDRGAQMQALNMFGQGAQGQGPSLAQMQGAQAQQQAVTDQLGMLGMTRGGSMASQARAAQGIGAAGQMAGARDQAQLALAEQQANQQAFANQANLMAGQSGGFMGQNADIATQWGLGQRGMDLSALGQRQQNQLGWADRIIGAGAGLGQVAMFSDENLKTDMRDAAGEAGETLAMLGEVGYRYKDKRHGPDDVETIGIKAQDLQKTKAGRRVVFEVPGEGLAVDMPGSLSLLMAHGGDVERRLRKIEGRG